MPADYLHNHKQFPELIRIVAEQKDIDPALVEKDCKHPLWAAGCSVALGARIIGAKGWRVR
jgi:hypothetical protein